MSAVVYDIPVHLVAAYSGQQIIVRSDSPAELVRALGERELENLVGVRLLSLTADVDPLAAWGYSVPVELVMRQPETEFSRLYGHAKLLDKHPVRVSIPVISGFSKAVKVATALQFTVKLEINQPDPMAVEEARTVLDFYLHHSSVTQPIEFFHSALLAFYRHDPATLWDMMEEDPARLRFVTDDCVETIARQHDEVNLLRCDLDSFLSLFKEELLAGRGECCGCEFFNNCMGYFKWPRRGFSCVGVKKLLGAIKEAANELRQDLESLPEAE